MTQTPALAEARVIDGKYRVEAPLGEGSTGAVYRVLHLGLGRAFALKELKAPYDVESQATPTSTDLLVDDAPENVARVKRSLGVLAVARRGR